MDGLEAQLHPYRLFLVQPGKENHSLIRQTVGPGADGQGADLRQGDGLCKQGFQIGERGVGVGVGLEIGDIQGVGTGLFLHQFFCQVCLLPERELLLGGKIPGAALDCRDCSRPGPQSRPGWDRSCRRPGPAYILFSQTFLLNENPGNDRVLRSSCSYFTKPFHKTIASMSVPII